MVPGPTCPRHALFIFSAHSPVQLALSSLCAPSKPQSSALERQTSSATLPTTTLSHQPLVTSPLNARSHEKTPLSRDIVITVSPLHHYKIPPKHVTMCASLSLVVCPHLLPLLVFGKPFALSIAPYQVPCFRAPFRLDSVASEPLWHHRRVVRLPRYQSPQPCRSNEPSCTPAP